MIIASFKGLLSSMGLAGDGSGGSGVGWVGYLVEGLEDRMPFSRFFHVGNIIPHQHFDPFNKVSFSLLNCNVDEFMIWGSSF